MPTLHHKRGKVSSMHNAANEPRIARAGSNDGH